VPVDARGPGDATPLFLAAWNGHVEAVRALLEMGADANAVCGGTSVWTKVSLHFWSERHRAVARALLDHGASCTFAEACTLGHVPAIERLLASDPDAKDRPGPNGKTPIDVAVLRADVALARRLLDAGASDPRGRARALVAATAFADRDVSRQLHRRSTFALTTFHDCSFADTTFSNVNLAGALFDNVNLGGARIDDAHVTGLTIFGIEVEPLLRKELERRAKMPKRA
jgi:ankyrin repeat protein